MTWPLGIDPGETGAAVLLRPDRRPDKTHDAVLALAWRSRGRGQGYTVREVLEEGPLCRTSVGTLGEVGELLRGHLQAREWAPLLLTVEGQFVAGHGGFQSTLTLTRAAGKVQGPLEQLASRIEQPTSRQWRPKFRMHPNASAKAASRHALKIAPRLVRGLGELATNEHVAEAALLAVYGWQGGRRR